MVDAANSVPQPSAWHAHCIASLAARTFADLHLRMIMSVCGNGLLKTGACPHSCRLASEVLQTCDREVAVVTTSGAMSSLQPACEAADMQILVLGQQQSREVHVRT